MVVEYYETANGKYPVEEFIQKQEKNDCENIPNNNAT